MTRHKLHKKHLERCKQLFSKFRTQGDSERSRKVYLIMKRLIERRDSNV